MGGRRTDIDYADYIEFPIVDVAKRCGVLLNSKTLERREVEASCPFCKDHGPGKHHLFLNTERNLYWCALCGARGNSVSLYARQMGVSYKEAADALMEEARVYPFPTQPESQTEPEREPLPLSARHDVYYDMLTHLTLSDKHREDLRRRGLTDERIERNMYRTLPKSEDARRFLAGLLHDFHQLDGIPGFGIWKGWWTVGGYAGLMVPYCDKDGYIQGIQIRLDDENDPERKYRWLSSRHLLSGTRCPARIHVTGNQSSRIAYLTEGGLKGDVASFLDNDALFVCFAGVNSLANLKDVLMSLDIDEVAVALDMDKLTNWRVRKALKTIYGIVASAGLKARPLNWNMTFKGVDDFYQARRLAALGGQDMSQITTNEITARLAALWKKEYPRQDRGFLYACEWEEKRVPLSTLECDKPRDLKKARRYLNMLQEGSVQFPPLVCVNATVIDGQHRFWAYTQAGYESVTIYQNVPWALPMAA